MNIRLVIFCTAALALPIFSSLGTIEENGGQRLVDDAVRDLRDKGFDAALGKLLEAERLDPNSASILNLLGAVYTKKKHFKTAKVFFENSLAQEPSFFPPL